MTHVDICKRHNAAPASRMQFLVSSAEELPEKLSPASAGSIFVGEALALVDTEVAFCAFSKVLKPGANLVFYDKEACDFPIEPSSVMLKTRRLVRSWTRIGGPSIGI